MTAKLGPGLFDKTDLLAVISPDQAVDRYLLAHGLFRSDIGTEMRQIGELLAAPHNDLESLKKVSLVVRALLYVTQGQLDRRLATDLCEHGVIDVDEIEIADEIANIYTILPINPIRIPRPSITESFLRTCIRYCTIDHVVSSHRLTRAVSVIGETLPITLLRHADGRCPIMNLAEKPFRPDHEAQIELLYRWMKRENAGDVDQFNAVCKELDLEPHQAAIALKEHVEAIHRA